MRRPAGFVWKEGMQGQGLVREDLAGLQLEDFWMEGRELAGAKGRGGVRQAELAGMAVVLRDYRRGGVLGGILRQTFFDVERAARELTALAELHQAGVPVVEPIAAVARGSVGHRLRLITRLVDGALPLPAFVAAHPELRRAVISEAGQAVAAAFAAGLVHPDLHPDNLIARRGFAMVEVYLLDLDRAQVRAPVRQEVQDRMLVRALRYLHKHRERLAPARFGKTDRLRFPRAMGLDRAERRAATDRLDSALQRELRRHGYRR